MHVCPPPRYFAGEERGSAPRHRGRRLETGKPVLLLDWDADITYLNHRISDNAVWGSALQEGQTFPLQLHTGE